MARTVDIAVTIKRSFYSLYKYKQLLHEMKCFEAGSNIISLGSRISLPTIIDENPRGSRHRYGKYMGQMAIAIGTIDKAYRV